MTTMRNEQMTGTPLNPPDYDGTPPIVDLIAAIASIAGGIILCHIQGWHGLVPIAVGCALGWRFVRWLRWWLLSRRDR